MMDDKDKCKNLSEEEIQDILFQAIKKRPISKEAPRIGSQEQYPFGALPLSPLLHEKLSRARTLSTNFTSILYEEEKNDQIICPITTTKSF